MKKIVLIAGKKSHGPEGNGIHDYPWSVKLLKVMLDNSNVADKVRVEFHLDGWPQDDRTLDDADAIMIISDGRDGDLFEEAPHFSSEARRKQIAKQMARGCGFLTFHFSTFAPDKYAVDILNWSGGYFDWETDGKKQWYSAIKTLDTAVQLGTPDHPVLRGVKPCQLREEFYYNIRFADGDQSLKPLWVVPAVEGRAEHGNVVAWAKERNDGGRGFGTTCGHFYDNWQNADFRRMILNALLWTAKADVPVGGVEAKYYSQAEITRALSGKLSSDRAVVNDPPIKALIMTGHQYPGHLWKDTTPAIKAALLTDPRIEVDVSEQIEDFATEKVAGYDLLVLNYCNWEKPGLSEAAKAGFVKYLQNGGGLILIHFSNGAFHFSLPKAGDSDWPEYRNICRRVWDHTPNKSGHDAYAKFVVDIAKADHPITKGMEPFETIDELYFRQQGEEPIEVLLTAKSKVTGKDEPMAFVYTYGQGRVMQTVLGHAAESLQTPGVVDLLRRSAAWVATREQTLASSQTENAAAKSPVPQLVEGRFGKALDTTRGGLAVTGHETFRKPPLTVECWAKLANKTNYNILVAQENKPSATHWELFSMVGTGTLTAYLPGYKPDHVTSDVDIADDRWHHLAMIYEPNRVRLFVDGKPVADQKMEFQGGKSVAGGLAIGQLVDKVIGCTGLIDEVCISRGVREIKPSLDKPLPVDGGMLGLWRFDELDDQGRSPDASAHNRPAAVSEIKPKKPSDNAFYHWSKDVVGFDWTEQDSVDNRWSQTDVGPFLASIVPMPGQPPVSKGLSIKVGDKASVCYDTQTMALRSAWTGGFLKFDPARYGIIAAPQMDREVQFLSSPDAGWMAKDVRYLGLYQSHAQVVLTTQVDGVLVRETPGTVTIGPHTCFTRTWNVSPAAQEMRLRIGRFSHLQLLSSASGWKSISWKVEDKLVTAAMAESENVDLQQQGEDLQIVIQPRGSIQTVKLLIFAADVDSATVLKDQRPEVLDIPRIELLLGRGNRQGPTDFMTKGTIGTEAGPYQIDTFTIPFENDANALFFITGHDFLANGDIVVCTVHGDVWLVSDMPGNLEQVWWRRFATGLFQPLGLKVVADPHQGDAVYVLGRDRITKLIDHNQDGIADRYENFCDLYETSPGGHDYVACLETDPEGNFYFVHAKQGVQKVSKDGKKLTTVATGLRNPNGLSVSPTGEITATPQEGEWTPASAIFLVNEGNHFGYLGPKITAARPRGYDPPLCWIPRLVDNSCAGQVWTPDDAFGLPKNSLLHFSFGQCTTLLVLRESIDGQWQGGVIPMPWKFQSGLSRGRFSPHDGHLYVSGLKGWVTSAVQDGCLQRIRYVGGDAPWPIRMETYQNGIALTFGTELDKASAENPDNYSVQACNYRYSQAYGSPDFRPSHPTVEGRDDWDVASATLLPDGKTIFLEIADVSPVMQVIINWSIASADQLPLRNSYHGTIHQLPERVFDVPESSYHVLPGRLSKTEVAALKPGVLVETRSGKSSDMRWARQVAGRLADGNTTFTGYIKAPLSGQYQFRWDGILPAKIQINADTIAEQTDVKLHKGYNRVSVLVGGDAPENSSNRLLWSSAMFAEEPVPATVWFHDGKADLSQRVHRRQRGRDLFETLHCARCHQAEKQSADFTAPGLKELSGRVTPRWLTGWLLDPRSIRHDAEMPALFHPDDRQSAADVAKFLLSLSTKAANDKNQPAGDVPTGLSLFEDWNCIACHRMTAPAAADPWQRSSLHFTAEKFPQGALTRFLQRPQQDHPFSRMPDFRMTETEAASLAAWIQSASPGRLDEPSAFAAANSDRGKRLFAEKRCSQCHGSVEPDAVPAKVIPFPATAAGWSRGCLSDITSARGNFPAFFFSAEDLSALRDLMRTGHELNQRMSAAHRSTYLMQRLRCTACHHRDQVISLRGEILSEESDSGVPPVPLPNLTFSGEKLHPGWMRRLFRGELASKTRPWLTARMPAFPAYADELADGLAAEHGSSYEPESSISVDVDLAEIGRKLTLKDHGLDCRQCHAVAGQQPTGDDQTKIAPGIDFAETKRRLRGDFYRRFVLDPPRFDISIRMPKLSLDGKTTQATDVFEGNADRQFDAVWHYIQSLPE